MSKERKGAIESDAFNMLHNETDDENVISSGSRPKQRYVKASTGARVLVESDDGEQREMSEPRKQVLLSLLAAFDPTVKAFWDDEGFPKIEMLNRLAEDQGDEQNFTEEEVIAVAGELSIGTVSQWKEHIDDESALSLAPEGFIWKNTNCPTGQVYYNTVRSPVCYMVGNVIDKETGVPHKPQWKLVPKPNARPAGLRRSGRKAKVEKPTKRVEMKPTAFDETDKPVDLPVDLEDDLRENGNIPKVDKRTKEYKESQRGNK